MHRATSRASHRAGCAALAHGMLSEPVSQQARLRPYTLPWNQLRYKREPAVGCGARSPSSSCIHSAKHPITPRPGDPTRNSRNPSGTGMLHRSDSHAVLDCSAGHWSEDSETTCGVSRSDRLAVSAVGRLGQHQHRCQEFANSGRRSSWCERCFPRARSPGLREPGAG